MKYQDEFLAPFLSEAVEASRCQFFENWLMKLKCPNLLKPLDTIIHENYQPFYHSEPFRILLFQMRHPVYYKIHLLKFEYQLVLKVRQNQNEFNFTTMRLVFVCFLKTPIRLFEIN